MVGHINQLIPKKIESSEVKEASISVLVSPQEGWEGHVLRVLDVEKDGYTPKHSHPWYHVNYVLEGEGELLMDNQIHPISTGSYAYVPGHTLHQFRNTGTKTLKFICIVPEIGHK